MGAIRREGFRSRQIDNSQFTSQMIRSGYDVGFKPAKPARYTSEEGFQESVGKVKAVSPKRIRQAYGRE